MAEVYEDFPPEDNNLLNCMDSGNASADEEESDYETRLYSLIHYSEEDTLKAGDVISNSDTFSYVSKGTKVSRLNPVRNIIDAVDSSSPFGDKRSGSSLNQNHKFQSSENKLRNLLHAYKNTSVFSHSTPINNNCNQNKSLLNAFKRKTDTGLLWTESSKSNYLEIEDQSVSECINVTPLNESAFSDTASSDCSFRRKNNDFGSKSKKNICENNSEHAVGSSRKNLKHDRKVDGNYVGNDHVLSKSKAQLSRRKNNKSRVTVIKEAEYLASSKYSMELNRGKTSTPSLKDSDCITSKNAVHLKDRRKNDLRESVIVVDDSDSNSSILEMDAPVKEHPPVVLLSSEDEKQEAVGKINIEDEDDIVVLYSSGKKPNTVSSNENGHFSEDTPVQKKSKKKKKKERKVSSLSSQEITPSSWTEKMSHFYNDSWGGEDFDVKNLQGSMSGKRSKWPVQISDFERLKRMNGQRNIKCQRCNHYGHRARSCTEPQKPIVCLYCGIVGHVQTKCPTTICLRCGRPSMMYSYGCRVCSSNWNNDYACSVCNIAGHHSTDCPEIWRRYHSTTTEEDLVNQARTMYKPCNQQYCSNCATRGHQYHECDESKQQGNSQKRANSSFTEQNKHAKRRKLDKQYSQMRLHQRNAKRANGYPKRANGYPLLSYFEPLYNRYM